MRRHWQFLLAVAATLSAVARADEANLPPAAPMLEKVLERAKQEHQNDRRFRSSYSYLRTRINRELDGKGNIKKEETRQARNNPVVRPTSYTLAPPAASINLTPKAGQAPSTGVRPVPVASSSPPNQSKAFDKNDFILNEDLLSRFDFTVVKREPLNGRDTLLIDFKPANKKLPSRNFKDRFINKAAGTIWIDEGDFVLAKVDLHLIESVNVVGGLVGAVKKLNYGFERKRTDDGLWYASDLRWRLEGREIFSRKILEYEETKSEVKRVP